MTDMVTAIIQGGSVGEGIFGRICEFDELRRRLVKLKPGPEKSELRHEIRELYAGQKRGH